MHSWSGWTQPSEESSKKAKNSTKEEQRQRLELLLPYHSQEFTHDIFIFYVYLTRVEGRRGNRRVQFTEDLVGQSHETTTGTGGSPWTISSRGKTHSLFQISVWLNSSLAGMPWVPSPMPYMRPLTRDDLRIYSCGPLLTQLTPSPPARERLGPKCLICRDHRYFLNLF